MATSRDPPTAVDESLKRNTDCIYFLASPLTCKKGSECEYRHSEYARVNPRDCWFWLNGNCLNPKCSFRHPPLDGLLGGQVGGQSGPPAAPPQAAPSAPQASARQPIPCIFFQKGYCLKGDRCSFLHGPNPPNVKMQQLATAVPVSEAPPPKKGSSGREKHPHLNTNLPANVSKVFGVPAEVNASKVKNPPASNAVTTEKRGPPSTTLIAEHTKSKETMAPPVNNGILRRGRAYQASSLDDRTIHNVRDADEPLRESSPGFDVLVDDKLRDTDYYHNDERYARMRGHDGRDLNEFEIGHHVEYGTMADADLETHNPDQRGYNSYERVQERYAWDTSRASSRGHHKSQSPDFVENSDLRHCLSKRGRMNGLRSVVSPDYNLNHHTEEGYQTTQRDTRSSPTRERSLSGRLQGRIKLPGRSPPIESGIVRSEGENERGWNLGRLGNRLRGRIQEDRDEGRNGRGLRMKKDTVHDNGFDFAAPKSLAELKGAKQTDNKQTMTGQQFDSLGKLKSAVSGPGSQQTEGDLSFEGPKPLSEILKRKRKAKSAALTSDNKEEIIKDSKKVTADEKGQDSNKKMKVTADEGKSSQAEDTKEPEIEEGLIASEEEDRDLEGYDKGDGEYEYEHDDGELDNFNNGEDAEHEEVFMDEDDGDDFAKKMGVSFS